jgi:hypothetical protein
MVRQLKNKLYRVWKEMVIGGVPTMITIKFLQNMPKTLLFCQPTQNGFLLKMWYAFVVSVIFNRIGIAQ